MNKMQLYLHSDFFRNVKIGPAYEMLLYKSGSCEKVR